MHQEIITFLLAMTPVGELRLAIPVGRTVYHLSWALTLFISIIGNLVPVALVLLCLNPLISWLSKKFKIFRNFFSYLFAKTRKKYGAQIQKYGYPLLVFAVAIPLPFTGGWSGSLVAVLLGIPIKKAFPLISSGIVISAFIVAIFTRVGIGIENYFGWKVLTATFVLIYSSWLFFRILIKKRKAIKTNN